jgi:hypothetical protein
MRIFAIILSGSLFFSGCAKMKSILPSAPNKNRNSSTQSAVPTVTLATFDPGRIAMVDPDGRFAVVTFPFGSVPGKNQRLNVYRAGLKVAELNVTGPHRDSNTVVDIISGEVRVHDEARAD